jgi:hypothetical protein
MPAKTLALQLLFSMSSESMVTMIRDLMIGVNPDLTRRLPVGVALRRTHGGAGLMIALQLAVATPLQSRTCDPPR